VIHIHLLDVLPIWASALGEIESLLGAAEDVTCFFVTSILLQWKAYTFLSSKIVWLVYATRVSLTLEQKLARWPVLLRYLLRVFKLPVLNELHPRLFRNGEEILVGLYMDVRFMLHFFFEH
jgi:hypothetical protein